MTLSHASIARWILVLSAGLAAASCGSSSGDDTQGSSPGAGGASVSGSGGSTSNAGTSGHAGASGASAGNTGASGHAGASGAAGSTGANGGGAAAGAGGASNGGAGGSSAGTSNGGSGGTAPSDPLDPSLAPPIDMDPAHYPASVWVTDGMVKVQPNASPGSLHWAIVNSAQNETESFQVHVQATSAPANLTVTVSDLVNAQTGTMIASASNVSVFREAYLDITTLSDLNGTLGKTPDPLIPTIDATAHEQRNAFPVTVPQNETRSAWVDVFVPPDAPSGYYTGSVTVSDGSTNLATLPIQIAVWDFALPSTASLRSGFGLSWNGLCVQGYGSYDACGAYPGASSPDDAIEKTHITAGTMFLDYRVSLGDVVYAPVTNGDFAHFDALYGPLLGGTADTQLSGAKMTGLWFSGDDTNSKILGDWQNHFASMATSWPALTAAYYCDEPPNGCSWSQALSKAQFIHTNAPGLPTLLTTDLANAQQHGLLDAVDVLVSIVEEMDPQGGPDARSTYDSWLQDPAKHLWWYQSCDEHEACSNGTPGGKDSTWPSYMVDASPVRNRIFQWLAYLNRIEGELYYATDLCWTQSCGDAASGDTMDPWVSIYTFGGNGDGTLFYPGTPAKIGGTTPVPVPSVRLALLRDGMEDFEYLHLLDASADGAFAQSAAMSFITDASTFDNDPMSMQAARRMLGQRIHKQKHP